MTANKLGRNDPCHCGSGNKYKKCHLPTDEAARSAELAAAAAASAAAAAAQAEAEAESEGAKEGGTESGTRTGPGGPAPRAGGAPKRPAQGHSAAPMFRRKAV